MACAECGKRKELVASSGLCWKCHLAGIGFTGPCKNCRQAELIKKNVTSKVTITPKKGV